MIKIYKNEGANAIFIQDDNGAQFLNSLTALTQDPATNTVSIYDNVKDLYLVFEEDYSEFVDENDQVWGVDSTGVINALNTIFNNAGTPTGDTPTITSPLSVTLTQGNTLNYELTADYGVGYEWDLSSVSGVTTVEGNVRKLIGGIGLTVGSYSIPVKAINYNGEDSQTLTLNVSAPPFQNTLSVEFQNNQWLGANAGILQNVLGRVGNGSGVSDAWTIRFLFKGGTSTANSQTIFYFGAPSTNNGSGHIYIRYRGGNDSLELRFGSNFNFLKKITQPNTLPVGVWREVMVSYDGGTTGAGSASLNQYYSRFKIFIDGVEQTNTTNSHSNFGYTGNIDPNNLRVGRYTNGNSMRNGCKVDELAIWDSDQSGNVGAIYNGGVTSNLSLLPSPPVHWWRVDGAQFPFLFDTGTAANCIFQMQSMSAINLTNDVR